MSVAIHPTPALLKYREIDLVESSPYVRRVIQDVHQYLSRMCADTNMTVVAAPAQPVRQNYIVLPVNIAQVQTVTVTVQFSAKSEKPPLLPQPKTLLDAILCVHGAIVHNWTMLKYCDQVQSVKQTSTENPEILTEHDLKMLKDFKCALLEYQNVLEELQTFCNVEGFQGKGPDYELLHKSKLAALRFLREWKVEEIRKLLPRTAYLTVDEIFCAILGLKTTFADYLKNLEERNHETFDYWVKNFVRDSLLTACDDRTFFSTDLDLLDKMQFTKSRAMVIHQWIENSPLKQHEDILYWVEAYLTDLLRNDILLNQATKHPFQTETGQLLTHSVTVDDCFVCDGQDSCTVPVTYVNFKNVPAVKEIEYHHSAADDEHEMLYHGTDHEAAGSIILDGINLDRGKDRQDFSDGSGFYFGSSFEEAIKWAKQKSSKPAVIAFKIPSKVLSQFSGLDLCDNKLDLWTKIIRFNRNGRKRDDKKAFDSKDYLKRDYVVGPICLNPEDCSSPNKQLHGYGRSDMKQLCVLSDSCALAFGCAHYVDRVFFFKV